MTIELYLGDCLEILPTLPAQSVDAIITDLPYGTTACKWDTIIPFDDLWRVVKHVLKPKSAFVTTASQPFTSALVMSNPKWFKYEWAWNKNTNTCFVHVKHRPLGAHENILIFGGGKTIYNPQMKQGAPYYRGEVDNSKIKSCPTKSGKVIIGNETGLRYPKTVLEIDGNNRLEQHHPTQKPVALMEYLIRTYTNEGDTVLDMCMGSGTTLVACVKTNRNGIGVEKEPEYFEIAKRRIEEAQRQMILDLR
jgi:site-specific DNA-methyltransferase (adenine-specific)